MTLVGKYTLAKKLPEDLLVIILVIVWQTTHQIGDIVFACFTFVEAVTAKVQRQPPKYNASGTLPGMLMPFFLLYVLVLQNIHIPWCTCGIQCVKTTRSISSDGFFLTTTNIADSDVRCSQLWWTDGLIPCYYQVQGKFFLSDWLNRQYTCTAYMELLLTEGRNANRKKWEGSSSTSLSSKICQYTWHTRPRGAR